MAAKPIRLLNRNFLLLWQGQFVSQIGSQAFYIAMMFWIKHQTGSASLVGLLMMASHIPAILLGPVAGTYADRRSRKRIIVGCDLINGVAVLTMAGLLFFAPAAVDFAVVWLFVVCVLVAAVSSFFRPAISASIPDLVPSKRVAGANSMNQFSMQLSQFLGQGSGGVLYRILGAPFLFLIDGLSYIFSAISESFITIPQEIPEKSANWRETARQFKSDLVAGFRYVWGNPGLRSLFFVAALLNFFLIPFAVLMPFFVEDTMNSTPDWFGYLMAAFGVGAMLGYVIAGAVKLSARVRAVLVLISIIGMCAALTFMAALRSPVSALMLWIPLGLLNGFTNINIMTILQISTPSAMRGRVFGLLATLSNGLTPIGMGLSGVVADLLDQNIPLVFLLSGGTATLLAIVISFGREFRRFLAYEAPVENTSATQDNTAP